MMNKYSNSHSIDEWIKFCNEHPDWSVNDICTILSLPDNLEQEKLTKAMERIIGVKIGWENWTNTVDGWYYLLKNKIISKFCFISDNRDMFSLLNEPCTNFYYEEACTKMFSEEIGITSIEDAYRLLNKLTFDIDSDIDKLITLVEALNTKEKRYDKPYVPVVTNLVNDLPEINTKRVWYSLTDKPNIVLAGSENYTWFENLLINTSMLGRVAILIAQDSFIKTYHEFKENKEKYTVTITNNEFDYSIAKYIYNNIR